MAGFNRPRSLAPIRRKPENVLPFRKHPKASRWIRSLRGRLARLPIKPLMIAVPLAAFMAVFFWDGGPPGLAAVMPVKSAVITQDRESARFGKCWGRSGENCVIDGDSLKYQGRHIRIADINAPELGKPHCDREFELGQKAEDRLQALLNAAPFRLEPIERSHDRYGRELFTLTRKGESIGLMLVSEGLAHEWHGRKLDWCMGS